jgi:two-component system cell cycle response regulator CpdR
MVDDLTGREIHKYQRKYPQLHRSFTKLAPDFHGIGASASVAAPIASLPLSTGPATVMTAKPSCVPARRILLAEDDESMRAFIERALIKAGYEVISFANGKEAHECLTEESFTLLLTDIVMPQMDGIELARRASEIHPELKIMFITGFAAVTLNTDSKAVKEARVLSKPFHLKDLVREIDRLLGP